MGYIYPYWIETYPKLIDRKKTTIVLPLDKKEFDFNIVASLLKDINPESILFLTKIREIHIDIENEFSISIIKEINSSTTTLLFEEKNKAPILEEYLIVSELFFKPVSIDEIKRIDIKKREVTVAFPITKNKKNSNSIFAYLPIKNNTGLPFLINADFLLSSSREGIQDGKWNEWLRDCISTVFVKGFLEGLKYENIREKMYSFIPLESKLSFLEPIIDEIHNKLKGEKIILVEPDNTLSLPQNTRLASKDFRNLFIDNFPKNLTKDLRIVDSNINKYKERLKIMGVKNFTPEEMIVIFRDISWIKQQSYTRLIQSYEYLLSQRFDNYNLKNLCILPIINNNSGQITYSCDEEQAIYFEFDDKLKDIILTIPKSVNVPVKFLDKKFYKLIKDNNKLCESMTKHFYVYNFSRENYAVDLMEWFKKNYNKISESDFINLSYIIVELSSIKEEFKSFPILLNNGERVLKSEENNKQVVTPETFDKDLGWQNIWKNDEDRKHLLILSNKYINHKDINSLIKKIGIIRYPSLQKKDISEADISISNYEKKCSNKIDRSTYSKRILNYIPPSLLLNFNNTEKKALFSNSFIEWLKHVNKPEFEKQLILSVKYYFYSSKLKRFPSEFLYYIKNTAWLLTTKGYLKPSEAFLYKDSIKDIFGETLPYFKENLPEYIIKVLDIKTEISFEQIIKLLNESSLKEKDSINFEAIKKCYKYLENTNIDNIRDNFKNAKLIYIPNNGTWLKLEEVFWSDKSEVFGNDFYYLEKYYPEELKLFFLNKLEIVDVINPESYAKQWLKLQKQEDYDCEKIERSLTIIYKELLPIFNNNDKESWLSNFIDEALIWTQGKSFEKPKNIFISDDLELEKVFRDKVEFIWRPGNYNNIDLKHLYESLNIPYLSQEVKLSINNIKNEDINNEILLTKDAKVLILSWLFTKEENLYNNQPDLVDSILNTNEVRTEDLSIYYTLGKFEENKKRSSFWDIKEKKLYTVKDKDDLKNSIANNIARSLLSSKDYKDYVDFIEVVLGSKSYDKKIKEKDFKIPNDVKEFYCGTSYSLNNNLLDNEDIKPEFPVYQVLNPQRRGEKIRESEKNTPEKVFEKKERSIRVLDTSRENKRYLISNYTNYDKQLICQMCENEMPFKLNNNKYYFESVEILNNYKKEMEKMRLALCPLCSAKYRNIVHKNEELTKKIKNKIKNTQGNKIEFELGLNGVHSIRFTDKHLLDIKVIINNI